MTISGRVTVIAAAQLLAAACSPRGESTSVDEVAAPVAQPAAAAIQSSVATQTEPGSAPAQARAPASEAPTEPPPPSAEPAELRLVRYDCLGLRISLVDDEVFLHYRDAKGVGAIDRMDPRGGVEQSLTFNEDLDFGTSSYYDPIIDGIRGRWPDQIYVLASYDSRIHMFQGLFRLVDDGWTRVGPPWEVIDYTAIWPWIDRSILALANDVDYDRASFPRFVVVRGEAKAPWLGAVKRRAKCDSFDFQVKDLHLAENGSVAALVWCGQMWLSTWAPGKREATVRKLVPDDASARLLLGDDGQGFIAFDSVLVQWRDGALQPMSLPEGGALDEVDRGPEDEPWIRQGNVVSRWTADGWQRVMELPQGPRIWELYGLDRGTPWMKREDSTLSMQTADGQWHPVPLPPTSERDDPAKAKDVYFAGPADVWVLAGYYHRDEPTKFFGTEIRAVYTTRPVQAPAECGWAPPPS